jgi:hypothetical protein
LQILKCCIAQWKEPQDEVARATRIKKDHLGKPADDAPLAFKVWLLMEHVSPDHSSLKRREEAVSAIESGKDPLTLGKDDHSEIL